MTIPRSLTRRSLRDDRPPARTRPAPGRLARVRGWSGPFNCPDRTPRRSPLPGEAGEKCQQAIAKEGAKFLKTKTSTLSKCLLKSAPGACPAANDTTKIEQAARRPPRRSRRPAPTTRASRRSATPYATLTDENTIGSCVLSQHNAIADLIVAEATGV